jgi:hypothetical protein
LDGKLVTDLPSGKLGDGGTGRPSPVLRYSDKFEELCSYYMSIGMTYHEYWDGDATMVKYFREADELKRERRNSDLWLQAEKNKPFPFRSEPIPITTKGSREQEERSKKKRLENGKEAMRAMMAAINSRFKEKKKGGDAGNEC